MSRDILFGFACLCLLLGGLGLGLQISSVEREKVISCQHSCRPFNFEMHEHGCYCDKRTQEP